MLHVVRHNNITYSIPFHQCIASNDGSMVIFLVSWYLANQANGEIARHIIDAQLLIFFRSLFIINNPSTYFVSGFRKSHEDNIFATGYSFATGNRRSLCCTSWDGTIAAKLFIVNNNRTFVALKANEEIESLSRRNRPRSLTFQFVLLNVLTIAIFKEPIGHVVAFNWRCSKRNALAGRNNLATLNFFTIHYSCNRTASRSCRLKEYTITFGEFVAICHNIKVLIYRLNLKNFRVLRVTVNSISIHRPVREFISREFIAAFHFKRATFSHFPTVFNSDRSRCPSLDKAWTFRFYLEVYAIFLQFACWRTNNNLRFLIILFQCRFHRFVGYIDRQRSFISWAAIVVVAKSCKLCTFVNINELYTANLAKWQEAYVF